MKWNSALILRIICTMCTHTHFQANGLKFSVWKFTFTSQMRASCITKATAHNPICDMIRFTHSGTHCMLLKCQFQVNYMVIHSHKSQSKVFFITWKIWNLISWKLAQFWFLSLVLLLAKIQCSLTILYKTLHHWSNVCRSSAFLWIKLVIASVYFFFNHLSQKQTQCCACVCV